MRYAGIIYNDTAAAPGLNVTLFTQGCPHRCKGCHNPETWDYDSGYEYTEEVEERIVEAISANGVIRNLSIMGGEPLLPENIDTLYSLTQAVRDRYEDKVKIFLWTGFTVEELEKIIEEHPSMADFLFMFDYIIDGRYEEDKRNVTLPLRGSSNQNIYHVVDRFNHDGKIEKIFDDEKIFKV